MKNMKVVTVAVAIAAAASLALAGCAPGGASSGGSTSGTTGTLDHNMKGKLTYWGWQGSTSLPAEIAAFNKVYPNIKVTYKQLDNDPKYSQELTPGLLSNSGPDIFMLPPGVKVDTYKSYARDLVPLAKQQLGSDWKSKINSIAIDSYTRSGKLVAAPIGSQSTGTWLVNVSMLKKLGLDVPSTSMSMDDLVAFCKTVDAAGKDCLSVGGQAVSLTGGQFESIAESVSPGKYSKAVAGTLPWTDPDLVKALKLTQQLYTNGVYQAGAVGAAPYPDIWQQFLQQKAAMTVLGTWTLGNYTKTGQKTDLEGNGLTANDGFTVELVPAPDLAGSGTVPQLSTSPGAGDAINVKTKNQAAAEAYIAWKDFSTSGQQFVANALVFLPAMIGVSPKGLDLIDPTVQESSLKSIFAASSKSHLSNVIPCADVATAVTDAMQQLGTGTSADTVAATLQSTSAGVDRKSCT